jgi:hypothetical protein
LNEFPRCLWAGPRSGRHSGARSSRRWSPNIVTSTETAIPTAKASSTVQHNWEAGTDNSPVYDAALEAIDLTRARDVSRLRRDNQTVAAAHRPTDVNYRRYLALVDLFNACGYRDAEIAERSPFLIQDVLFNAVLARSNLALLSLARGPERRCRNGGRNRAVV